MTTASETPRPWTAIPPIPPKRYAVKDTRPTALQLVGLALGIVLCLMLGPASSALAGGADARCFQLFRSKQYLNASECFESVAQALGASHTLSKKQKNYKGRLLRNAAIALRKYANQLSIDKGSKWRMRALKHLKTYQKEKLCENAERCRLAGVLAGSIRREVGFTPLTVTTGSPDAQIELIGTAFSKKGRSNQLRWDVPPGTYVVNVTYPGQAPRSKKVTVSSGSPALLSFAPPAVEKPKPPPTRLGPWIVLGAGAAVAVAGGIILLVGQIQENAIHQDAAAQNKASTEGSKTTSLLMRHEQNGVLFPAGWIVAAVGLAAAAGGLIWAILPTTPKSTTSTHGAKHTKHTLVQLLGAPVSAEAGK